VGIKIAQLGLVNGIFEFVTHMGTQVIGKKKVFFFFFGRRRRVTKRAGL